MKYRAKHKVDAATVRVAVGMTLCNNAKFLPEAIESILNQTHTNFGVILLDDQSTDKTEIIATKYVARDRRLQYAKTLTPLGMVAAWRRAFELARKRFPNAEYFAWASDHDYWAPDWLATLVDVLDRDPSVMVAYPRTIKMSPSGRARSDPEPDFETPVDGDLRARWAHVSRKLVGAGNMVYGLARVEALERAGVFRRVLLPDRLLMAELALQGHLRRVSRPMWYRRRLGRSSIPRQRRTLFGPGGPPLYAYLPWWAVHAATLVLNYGVRRGPQRLGLLRAGGMALQYSCGQVGMILDKFRERLKLLFRPSGVK